MNETHYKWTKTMNFMWSRRNCPNYFFKLISFDELLQKKEISFIKNEEKFENEIYENKIIPNLLLFPHLKENETTTML
jgi:hypothetical protein